MEARQRAAGGRESAIPNILGFLTDSKTAEVGQLPGLGMLCLQKEEGVRRGQCPGFNVIAEKKSTKSRPSRQLSLTFSAALCQLRSRRRHGPLRQARGDAGSLGCWCFRGDARRPAPARPGAGHRLDQPLCLRGCQRWAADISAAVGHEVAPPARQELVRDGDLAEPGGGSPIVQVVWPACSWG